MNPIQPMKCQTCGREINPMLGSYCGCEPKSDSSTESPSSPRKFTALRAGIFWGGTMFLIFTGWIAYEGKLTWTTLGMNAAAWTIGGTLFGLIMQAVVTAKNRKQ